MSVEIQLKGVRIKANGGEDFYIQVKGASTDNQIENVFRGHDGFYAVIKGTETKIQPHPKDKQAYDNFFYGQALSFEGVVGIPEIA